LETIVLASFRAGYGGEIPLLIPLLIPKREKGRARTGEKVFVLLVKSLFVLSKVR
jgi:hypothetical protein